MDKIRREVEVRGADIERAVAQGLAKLGLSRSEVIVEVVDEGSRGLLGLGSRDAIVIVKEITPTGEPVPVPEPEPVIAPPPSPPRNQPRASSPPPQKQPEKVETKPVEKKTAVSQPQPQTHNNDSTNEEPSLEDEQALAIEIVNGFLEHMDITAEISGDVSEPDDLTGKRMNVINIEGDDLGVLIGPRGETLGALQYISRLMVGHKLRQRSNFVLDIEGYRSRREQALRRLAERMAEKVIKRGRAMTLEPMPPNERRIIHMTLRENTTVETHSVGEGERRKVRIVPKK